MLSASCGRKGTVKAREGAAPHFRECVWSGRTALRVRPPILTTPQSGAAACADVVCPKISDPFPVNFP